MHIEDNYSYTDFSQPKITHISFDIDIDFSHKILIITAKYSFSSPITGSIHLDTRDLEIKRVYGTQSEFQWEKNRKDEILGERLNIVNLKRINEIMIKFKTSSHSSAIQWLPPERTTGGKHPFLFTQCQSIHARSIFPCQDTPSIRFTYDAKLRVSKPLVAIMAAEKHNTIENLESSIYHYKMPQPIPSYLFAFAVGKLDFREIGWRTGVYAEPDVIDAASWEFTKNEEKIKKAEALLGPYQWERFDILIMPSSFPYGGMENPRLTFLSNNHIQGDRTNTFVISHELAHAWTGNLVTNATWDDIWLNEGWAMYVESRITELIEGEDVNDLFNMNYYITLKEDIERFGSNSPLTILKTTLNGIDLDEAFSLIPYIKGKLFLQNLEDLVGRKKFDAFIKNYISKYKFQSITTEEFLVFLNKELPEVGANIDIFLWIYKPGLPKISFPIGSNLYNDVLKVVNKYKLQKARPTKQQTKNWNKAQIVLFLRNLPHKISAGDIEYFDSLFNLGQSKDIRLLLAFFMICLENRYERIFSRITKFTRSTGHQDVLGRLFRKMVKTEWIRGQTRSLFEDVRDTYHPITNFVIEQILTNEDL